jgi:hypothetical protein
MKNGIPITEHQLPRMVETGITLESELGLVPEYEEREAARFYSLSMDQWNSSHPMERAKCVAHYRLHHMIEAFTQKAVQGKRN